MLIYNSEWKVNKDASYVYKEGDASAVCTIHTANSTEPSEGPTEPTGPSTPTEPPAPTEPATQPPAPTEPSAAAPPDMTEWFERRRIGL